MWLFTLFFMLPFLSLHLHQKKIFSGFSWGYILIKLHLTGHFSQQSYVVSNDLGTSCWLFPCHVLLKRASVWAKLEAHYRIQCSCKTPVPPALMLGQCRCTSWNAFNLSNWCGETGKEIWKVEPCPCTWCTCPCTWCTCLRGDYLNKEHWINSCSKQHKNSAYKWIY